MAESFARPRAVQDKQEVRLSRAELLEAAGLDEETLTELEDYGLLAAKARRYDEDALKVARSVGALARFGLHARHLRAVKAAAEREAGLVEQTVAPILKRRAPGAIGEADEAARELSTRLLELHAALLRTGVRSVLGPMSGPRDIQGPSGVTLNCRSGPAMSCAGSPASRIWSSPCCRWRSWVSA